MTAILVISESQIPGVEEGAGPTDLGDCQITQVSSLQACLDLLGSGKGPFDGIVLDCNFPEAEMIMTICCCHPSFRDIAVVTIDEVGLDGLDWLLQGAYLFVEGSVIDRFVLSYVTQVFRSRTARRTMDLRPTVIETVAPAVLAG